MKLGPCPICKKDLHIYKSLHIDDFKRYDYRCKTKGCMINILEWNYEDKQVLVKAYNRSMNLSKHECKCKPAIKDTAKKVKKLSKKKSCKMIGISEIITYDHDKDSICSVPKTNKKEISIHYTPTGIKRDIVCSSRSTAKSFTENKNKVTCSRCKRSKVLSQSK